MINFIKDHFLYIAAIITSAKWVYEYTNKLRWEKNKLLLDKLEDFKKDPTVKLIHDLLDWNKQKISIGGNETLIDDEFLISALQTHDAKNKYTPEEKFIRGAFDEYFDRLGEFVVLSESGMILKGELRKHLKYWFEIISGKANRKPEKLVQRFTKYMEYYGWKHLHDFIYKETIIQRFLKKR